MITTDRQVAALKPGPKVKLAAVKSPHGGGLSIRVTPAGAKVWYFRYRHNGRADGLRLGTYPSMKLQGAREAHREARQLLGEGIDPKRAARQQKAENQAAWTMQELFERWITFYAKAPSHRTKRPPSDLVIEQTRWRWDYYLANDLGGLLAARVDASQVKTVIAEVAEHQSREQARKCLSMLRGMFDYGEARGQVAINPAVGIEPSKVGASKGASRSRALSLVELRRLWVAIEKARLDASTATAIRFLILTGQRRGETLLARWEHIDGRTWTIPAENAKNRKAHTIHLSDAAVSLLESVERKGDYVFEGRIPGQPISDTSLTTAIARLQGRKLRKRDAKAPLAGMKPFSVHDLRRSFATGLGEHCAVQPHIVERMLNHAPEDALVQTYQRAQYVDEQRQAWQAWGELVEGQVMREPENVVPLRRAK